MSTLEEPTRLGVVLDAGGQTYAPWDVRVADDRSRALSARLASPHAGAGRRVDGAIGRQGACLLSQSCEWGGMASAADDPGTGGSVLFRSPHRADSATARPWRCWTCADRQPASGRSDARMRPIWLKKTRSCPAPWAWDTPLIRCSPLSRTLTLPACSTTTRRASGKQA